MLAELVTVDDAAEVSDWLTDVLADDDAVLVPEDVAESDPVVEPEVVIEEDPEAERVVVTVVVTVLEADEVALVVAGEPPGNVAGFDLRKWSRCIRIIGARLGNNEIGDFAIHRHELPFAHASARAANVAGCGSVVVVANLLDRLKRLDADPDWAGQRHTIEADVRL